LKKTDELHSKFAETINVEGTAPEGEDAPSNGKGSCKAA
jgi:hypothetical protein